MCPGRAEAILAITGLGQSMRGEELATGLHQLAERCDEVAIPELGKHVRKTHD